MTFFLYFMDNSRMLQIDTTHRIWSREIFDPLVYLRSAGFSPQSACFQISGRAQILQDSPCSRPQPDGPQPPPTPSIPKGLRQQKSARWFWSRDAPQYASKAKPSVQYWTARRTGWIIGVRDEMGRVGSTTPLSLGPKTRGLMCMLPFLANPSPTSPMLSPEPFPRVHLLPGYFIV